MHFFCYFTYDADQQPQGTIIYGLFESCPLITMTIFNHRASSETYNILQSLEFDV